MYKSRLGPSYDDCDGEVDLCDSCDDNDDMDDGDFIMIIDNDMIIVMMMITYMIIVMVGGHPIGIII